MPLRRPHLFLTLLAALLFAGGAWLLGSPTTRPASVLAKAPAATTPESATAPIDVRTDATLYNERERVVPETMRASAERALAYEERLAKAAERFDHTYLGFTDEVDRRIASRVIEPLIDVALRCHHARCPNFVARFVSKPTRSPHSFLKALERRFERDDTMPDDVRDRLASSLFAMAASTDSTILQGRALDVGARVTDRASLRPFVELVSAEGALGRSAARRAGLLRTLECKTILLDLALHSSTPSRRVRESGTPMLWTTSPLGPPRELLAKGRTGDSVANGLLRTKHDGILFSELLRDVLDEGDEHARRALLAFALRTDTGSETRTAVLGALFATPGSDLLGEVNTLVGSYATPYLCFELVQCARHALQVRKDLADAWERQHILSVLDAHEATANAEISRRQAAKMSVLGSAQRATDE